MVLGRERQVGPADGATGEAEPVEGLGAGDLVEEVEVDVEEVGLPLGATDDVCVPDLLGECPCHDFPLTSLRGDDSLVSSACAIEDLVATSLFGKTEPFVGPMD